MSQNKNEKKYWAEDIPEQKRKNIFWMAMIIVVATIISLWIVQFKNMISSSATEPVETDQKWGQIQQDLNDFLQRTEKEFSNLSPTTTEPTEIDNSTTSTTATGTAEINSSEIEQLKKKLLEQTEKNN